MLAGLLQLENSNFEGVQCRKFNALSRDAYGFAPTEEFHFWRCCAQEICWSRVSIPVSPVSRQLNKLMEKKMLLEGLRIRKPPAEFQDVCRKTFCAVRAALQLEDFNVAGLTRRKFAVRRGFHYESWLSFPRSGSFTVSSSPPDIWVALVWGLGQLVDNPH